MYSLVYCGYFVLIKHLMNYFFICYILLLLSQIIGHKIYSKTNVEMKLFLTVERSLGQQKFKYQVRQRSYRQNLFLNWYTVYCHRKWVMWFFNCYIVLSTEDSSVDNSRLQFILRVLYIFLLICYMWILKIYLRL